jgi:thiol-disulfide isomerase/thioredoxin
MALGIGLGMLGGEALDAQATNQVGLPVGSVPDAVTLEDLDGNAVELSSFIGQRPVLLEFWATWCPVCAKLAPELDRAYARYGDRVEFVIVAVGINQSPRSIRRHLEDHPMPYPVLWDGRGRAVRAYKAPTTSYVAIVDASGSIAYTGVGEDQKLEAALEAILEDGSGDDPE